MKKLFATIALALGLGVTSQTSAQSLFTADELNLFGFADYIDQAGNKWGGGVGLSYYFARNIGIGVSTHWEDFKGSFFDNVSGEGYLRLPLGSSPIAAYGIGSVGYTWEYNNWFFGAGAGAEWRFSRETGLFSDVQWMFNEAGENNGVMVRIGLRLGM